MQKYPRVLVISNECLSTVSSNGRTLRNFLVGWPKSCLAQFHIRNVAPDDTVCNTYYYVSDSAALRSFLTGKAASGRPPEPQPGQQPPQKASAGRKRNAATMLLRNLVWNSMRWAGKDFDAWVDGFSPEVILLQAGDCGFMLRLARRLAGKYQIPLIIYNTEAYYFKNYDYFRGKGPAKWLYPLFRWDFCREFRKTLRMADRSIYCCDKLKEDYDEEFALPSDVIYTATELTPAAAQVRNGPLRVSYLGNLGVGRHEGLVQIGNALQRISPELKLDVYGKIPNDEVAAAFDGCAGIDYHGFVSYADVLEVMRQSDILIHTESFSAFYREDSKYAFSTKIADSLASGRCFLLYAPGTLACAEYLKRHEAACVVERPEDLPAALTRLCSSGQKRTMYVGNALRLAAQNHNAQKNSERFQRILRDSVEKRK